MASALIVKTDLAPFSKASGRLIREVLPKAQVRGLNNLMFDGREVLQHHMTTDFNAPTPFFLRSPFVNRATLQKPAARVTLREGGQKSGDPETVMRPHSDGGPRPVKRFERTLQHAGLMPTGFYAVPGEGVPLNQYGNIPLGYIVRLINALQASRQAGHNANMTADNLRKLAKLKRVKSDSSEFGRKKGYQHITGLSYFSTFDFRKGRDQRAGHLRPGIYTRSGLHGMHLKPILLFVRRPVYSKRLDMDALNVRIVEELGARQMARALDYEMRKAGWR